MFWLHQFCIHLKFSFIKQIFKGKKINPNSFDGIMPAYMANYYGCIKWYRQAIMVSFLTFAITRAYKTRNVPIVYLGLCVLAHNSGLFFGGILFFAVIYSKYIQYSRRTIVLFYLWSFINFLR